MLKFRHIHILEQLLLESELIITDQLSVLTQNNIDLVLLKKEFDVKNTIDYKIGKNLEESKQLLVKLEEVLLYLSSTTS